MDSNKLKLYVESVVQEVLEESSGNEPTKEQIDATFDLLKQITQNTPYAGKVFVAGGAVRDQVMGLDPKDIDLVVEMEDGGIKFAKYMAQRLGIFGPSNPVVFPTFGTAKIHLDKVTHNGVPLDGVDVEVVQTRSEEYEPGSRKPTTRHGTIKQDVFRRDLTINALLQDIISGEIVDLTGKGRDDIAKGVIRTPSEPDRIFIDDPLRLMRAVRFAGRYDYTMPDFMVDSIKKNASRLNTISRERIREELEKILKGANPEVGVRFLYDLELMPHVLPQIADKKEQAVEGAVRGNGFIGKLILMLSDVSPKAAGKAAKSLKFSNDEIKALTETLAGMQSIARDSSNANILKVGSGLHNAGLEDYIDFLKPLDKQVAQLEPFFSQGPVIHVDGGELIQKFGLKPGKMIGKLKALQQDMWYHNPRVTRDEVLARIKQELNG